MPVVQIDDRTVGDGKPGPIATALRREFHDFAEQRVVQENAGFSAPKGGAREDIGGHSAIKT